MPFYVGDDVLYVIYPINRQINILVSLFFFLAILLYILMVARNVTCGRPKRCLG